MNAMPSQPAEARRTYDSSRRQAQARRHRATILEACRAALLRDGYAGLTIRAVADAASVSQETIYKTFGGKKGLVKALYDVMLAGDDAPVPLAQRPEILALNDEADPRARVAAYARLARLISERVGAVTAALSVGGAEAAELTAQTELERLTGVSNFVSQLAARGQLRPGLDPTEGAEACWVLTSPEVYRLCTAGRGWSPDIYQAWLSRLMSAALLAPGELQRDR